MTPYRSRGRGDCRASSGHRTNDMLLKGRQEAQGICDALCDYLSIPRHSIILKFRKTKNLRGRYFASSKVIWLYYPRGMMTGTLLHEIAHYYVRGHRSEYKVAHTVVLSAFDKLYPATPLQTMVSAIDILASNSTTT